MHAVSAKFGVVSLPAGTDILSCEYYREFWVGWMKGTIRIGFGLTPYVNEVLQWTDPLFHDINSVGICTGYGAHGEWIVRTVDRECIHIKGRT